MSDFSFVTDLFIFLMVFFAGFIDCIAGGGGMITIPTYLSAGLQPSLVLGTNKFVSSIGTLSAVIRLLRSVKINIAIVVAGGIFAIVGSVIGAYLSSYLSHNIMIIMLLIIIPTILAIGSFSSYKTLSDYQLNTLFFIRLILVCFFIAGYDGFFGPGTGTFLFISLMYLLNMSAQESVVNAKIINFIANFSALLYFLCV